MNAGENSTYEVSNVKSYLPNPVMLSRQINGLREVMRRMHTAQSDSVEPLITKKLEQIAQS